MDTAFYMKNKLCVSAEFEMLLGDYAVAVTVNEELANVVLKRLRWIGINVKIREEYEIEDTEYCFGQEGCKI